jgi:hypothetical protein
MSFAQRDEIWLAIIPGDPERNDVMDIELLKAAAN